MFGRAVSTSLYMSQFNLVVSHSRTLRECVNFGQNFVKKNVLRLYVEHPAGYLSEALDGKSLAKETAFRYDELFQRYPGFNFPRWPSKMAAKNLKRP